jgi:hypothetical protein
MSADPIDLEAARLVGHTAADLLAVRRGECVCCYVGRMLDEFGCDCTLRFATRYRDSEAPRATGLERRLGQVGGYCDCEIFLNGWTLHQRFRTPTREVDMDGITTEEEMTEPVELPPCATVRRGSIRPCTNWVRH